MNIIKLDFSEINMNLEEQINVPSGLFPNLKVLNTNNNFIIPSSMLINLSELYISYKNQANKLLFLNDINKGEINLNNLEYLNISTSGTYKAPTIKKSNQKEKTSKKKYNIIFHITKLKILKMDISSYCDNIFLEKYFDLNQLEILDNQPLNKKRTTFIDLINKKEKYFKMMSIQNLYYINITYRYQYHIFKYYIRTFTMETTNNGMKNYCYSVGHINEDANNINEICFIEKYEEKKNKVKILKYYENRKDYNDISIKLSNIVNINVIKINANGRKINVDKINEIFDIKNNNYSLQEIDLSFKYNGFDGEKYYKNLIKNISKFKVLKKLFLYDPISIEKSKLFIDKISKLKLLEEIYIEVDAKLFGNIKTIKELALKKIPLCIVEVYNYTILVIKKIKQNISEIH